MFKKRETFAEKHARELATQAQFQQKFAQVTPQEESELLEQFLRGTGRYPYQDYRKAKFPRGGTVQSRKGMNMAQLNYVVAWLALLLLAALIVAAWVFPQAVMTGTPRSVLIVMGLLVLGAILASFYMRKR